jgi:hypothetical protein
VNALKADGVRPVEIARREVIHYALTNSMYCVNVSFVALSIAHGGLSSTLPVPPVAIVPI